MCAHHRQRDAGGAVDLHGQAPPRLSPTAVSYCRPLFRTADRCVLQCCPRSCAAQSVDMRHPPHPGPPAARAMPDLLGHQHVRHVRVCRGLLRAWHRGHRAGERGPVPGAGVRPQHHPHLVRATGTGPARASCCHCWRSCQSRSRALLGVLPSGAVAGPPRGGCSCCCAVAAWPSRLMAVRLGPRADHAAVCSAGAVADKARRVARLALAHAVAPASLEGRKSRV